MNKKILKIMLFALSFLLVTTNLAATSVEVEGKSAEIKNQEFDFDNIIYKIMKFGKIPSLSACIIKNDETIWANSYGFKDIEEKQEATINTQYIIASISKTVTATALLQLYEKNLFNLNENVNNYLDFELKNPYYPDINITFRMLLTHTASLDFEPDWFYFVNYSSPDPPLLSSWMKDYFYENETLIKDRWMNVIPSSQFRYSNLGFCIIGRLVEILSGKNINTYCKENIFIPLEMYNTSFNLSDLNIDDVAKPYILFTGQCDVYLPIPHYSVIMHPAGGLRTSVMDLSHFLIAHNNNGKYKNFQLLNKTTIDLMHTADVFNKKLGYGLGWGVFNTIPRKSGHSGSLYCYNSQMMLRDFDKTGIILFVNRDLGRDVKGKISYALIQQLLFLKAFKFYSYTN